MEIKNVILLVAALIFGIYQYGNDIKIPLDWTTKTVTVEVVPTKDRPVVIGNGVGLEQMVAAFKASPTTRDKKKDAYAMGDLYGDMAKLVMVPDLIKTNVQFREVIMNLGKEATVLGAGITPASMPNPDYPGVGVAIEAYITSQLGLAPSPLDVVKARTLLTNLQWQFYELAK